MTKLYTPQQLCDVIYQAVLCGGVPMSRLEICRAIHRHKSPHILAMIDQLVQGGWLVQGVRHNPRGLDAMVYSVGRWPVVDSPA